LNHANSNTSDGNNSLSALKGFSRPWTPGTPRANASAVGESFYEQVEPLPPDIILDLVWTESSKKKPGFDRKASKVEIATDFNGQKFLCLFMPSSQTLSMVKIDFSNEKKQMIFGHTTNIPAKDFGVLSELKLLVILDLRQVRPMIRQTLNGIVIRRQLRGS
jgi:hypothetical protein